MKADIHPQYQKTTVTCISCGTTFETHSTSSEIEVEVCSKCHPFYTGKRTLVDTAGRVEKFRMKMEKKAKLEDQGVSPKKAEKSKKQSKKKEERIA